MKSYSYLLILTFTIAVCFVASFHKRIRFHKHFGTFLLSATLAATPFILWDIWFTSAGVWWFNYDYTVGTSLAGLPVEEWLFFYCIPFACIFTFYCFEKFFDLSKAAAFNNIIVYSVVIICSLAILLFNSNIYTLVTAAATMLVLLFLHFVARKEWIGAATGVYLVLLPGFLAVNGPLTGLWLDEAVVNYNSSEITGKRIFTIPVEDAVYGFTLFLLNLYFFKLLQRRQLRKSRSYE